MSAHIAVVKENGPAGTAKSGQGPQEKHLKIILTLNYKEVKFKMAKGIVRKIDELGRITLPKEYRDTYGVKCGDPLGMLLEGNKIVLISPGPKFIGTVRKIDELGRYTLPIETRRVLGLEHGSEVDIFDDQQNDGISIQKHGEFCAICGRTGELFKLHPVKEVKVCESCVQAVSDVAKEISL